MTAAPGTDFAIEIRERYRDVISDRWPIAVASQPDELLSSWVHRLAIANGIAPRPFAGVFALGKGMWSASLDVKLPADVANLLHGQVGVPPEKLTAMSLAQSPLTLLPLPLRKNAERKRSTWLQFCSQCLAAGAVPYFRRRWRLSTLISCSAHGCGLRDRCPSCRSAIAVFDQTELTPQHFCARCGFDLRKAPRVSVRVAARRLERCIDDICRLEVARGSLMSSTRVPRLLRAPFVADARSASSLTSLSTSARIRCFERLAEEPDDWLAVDDNVAATHWRRRIFAAGGHGRLIGGLADFLERRSRPQPTARCGPPDADLPALLGAYARVMASSRRQPARAHSPDPRRRQSR